jgi:hypothetical protein
MIDQLGVRIAKDLGIEDRDAPAPKPWRRKPAGGESPP